MEQLYGNAHLHNFVTSLNENFARTTTYLKPTGSSIRTRRKQCSSRRAQAFSVCSARAARVRRPLSRASIKPTTRASRKPRWNRLEATTDPA